MNYIIALLLLTVSSSASSIFSFDLDGDGVNELITGWSNGKLDARNDRSGEVVFKDNFNHPIAGLVQGDYRQDGRMELIACATEGEVRGYQPAASDGHHQLLDVNAEQESLRELAQRKNNLLLELRNYEENQKVSRGTARSNAGVTQGDIMQGKEMGVIPARTQLSTALAINLGTDGKPVNDYVVK